MFGIVKRMMRGRVRKRAFPEAWRAILERNFGYYRVMDEPARERLHGLIHIFLNEKRFEGVGGLKMTDEIRVTIAAQACVLMLGRDDITDFFPTLSSIIVYPQRYVAPSKQMNPDGTVSEGMQGRLGESWLRGNVVLSWSDALAGGQDLRDGQNLVFHEFAHQLDGETGAVQGSPRLPAHKSYQAWASVLGNEFQQLRRAVQSGRPTLLNAYGATNPAEFFAVATETFFEKPVAMRREHPELYAKLAAYYAQDPAGCCDDCYGFNCPPAPGSTPGNTPTPGSETGSKDGDGASTDAAAMLQ